MDISVIAKKEKRGWSFVFAHPTFGLIEGRTKRKPTSQDYQSAIRKEMLRVKDL